MRGDNLSCSSKESDVLFKKFNIRNLEQRCISIFSVYRGVLKDLASNA